MFTLSEIETFERGPYLVLGCYATYEGGDEGPGWSGASQAFMPRIGEVLNRADDKTLGFLYRPHRDHPEIDEAVRAAFVGVEVTYLDNVPEGMSTTRFSGGHFARLACIGDSEDEAAMAVGPGVGKLMSWVKEQGYTEGDACFALSLPQECKPPWVEWVYMNYVDAGEEG